MSSIISALSTVATLILVLAATSMLLIRDLAQALGGRRWIATDAEAGRDVSTADGTQADYGTRLTLATGGTVSVSHAYP